MTASTPTSWRSTPGAYIVGMPPPPAQMTTAPCSSIQRIGRISKIRLAGVTGPRAASWPIGLDLPALLGRERCRGGFVVDRSDELGRVAERRVLGIDLDHGQERRERSLEREQVPELLLDEIADHPLRLRAEDVERVGLDVLVGGALESEQAHLRAVAVRDDELVLRRDTGQGLGGDADVGALVLDGHGLARVAGERCRRER